ncbi:hypothetical protein AB1484_30700 [Parafrankia sp. FMc6]|uniref:hypothetical protein n=1 Tax=Parafrankia soli TaxID=2599596 RepID=UPI0034D51A2C
MARSKAVRLAAVSAIGVLLAGVSTGVAWGDEPNSQSGIDVSVDIDEISTPGQVTLTVDANQGVALTENGSDAAARQFTGVTPSVTVTDSRQPDEIPAGDFWAVVGQASDFTASGDPTASIGAQYLGWTPHLLSGSSTGSVEAGEPVSSVISDGTTAPTVGLTGQELLVSTANSADEIGSWQVNADLILRTPVDVPAGEYHSTLTLSLFDQS